MHDVKITKDCYVPRDNINHYVSCLYYAVMNDLKEQKKRGNLIDYTNGKKRQTAIYLKNGKVIVVNTSIATIHERMMSADKN